jgi:hypothetical protein
MAEADRRDLLPRIAVPTVLMGRTGRASAAQRRTAVQAGDPGHQTRRDPRRRSPQQPRVAGAVQRGRSRVLPRPPAALDQESSGSPPRGARAKSPWQLGVRAAAHAGSSASGWADSVRFVGNWREPRASGDTATEAAAARLAVDPQCALLPVASRVCTETLAKLVQERYRRVPRAIGIRPADEALVRRHRAAARRLQACQGGRRAPSRRRPSTAHELPRLRRPRAALQLLPASFPVGTPRPRVVPGMSDDGRAIAPPLTAPHA